MEISLHGFKRSILAFLLFFGAMLFVGKSFGQGSQTFSTPGTTTFTVPAGVSNVKVECWGGGAGGNNGNNVGGGGGAFAGNNAVNVTPGSVITVIVGVAGDANTGTNIAGNSSFGSFVIAAGANTSTGGLASASTGTIVFSGGNGGTSTSTGGAGGGGSAGAGGAGGVGGSTTSGTGGVGGSAGAAGTGTAGAAGGAGGSTNTGGIVGNAPGGGGGERGSASGAGSGAGAAGRVIVTWTCPAATISYNLASFCKSATSGTVTINGLSGGTFSSTPGLTINNSTGVINPSTSTAGTYIVHYQVATGGLGCTAIDATTTVIINATPVTSVTGQSNVNCFAESDGSITISVAGGTAPYFYSVNNGSSYTAVASPSPFTYGGLAANTQFRIRVKDSNGCESK